MSASGYENMLEKYRDVDEDEIMSGLSKDELARLENEIDREILEKPPEYDSDGSDMYTTTTTSDDESESDQQPQREEQHSDDDEENETSQAQTIDIPTSKSKPEAFIKGKLDRTQLKPVQKTLQRQKSGGKHTFKLPALKKTSTNKPERGQPTDDQNSELKDELIQAVTKRNKRRTRRGNSSGVSVRRLSNAAFPKRRNSKITRYRDGNEHQVDAATVNRNIMTDEMLNLRPRLRKVAVKEPKLVLPDELHGVSFNRITAGAKKLQDEDDVEAEAVASDDGDASRNSAYGGYDADNDVTPSLSDESYVVLGDDIEEQKERQQALSECSEAPSDGVMTMASTASTSAESCDVFGELSINPNSVEEMVERVLEDDPMLTEVNLNNIHDVPIERFEELAEAMEKNTHVTSLTLANTGLTDRAAKAMATMLKRNSTLKTLNLESNFITGEGARRLVSALRKNTSLTELLLDNQRHIFGAKVEFEIAKFLKENTSLLKFGYQFANPGPRMATSNILTKNMDVVRKRRVAEEKKRQQAGLPKRPALRRQPSSEWYRKERLERLKKLQQQSKLLGLDLTNNIGDGEVEKVLKNMNPEQVSVLERWFTSKLLGMVDQPPKAPENVDNRETAKEKQVEVPEPQLPEAATSRGRTETKQQKQQQESVKPKHNLLRPPPRKSRSKSPVVSRDDLMDSIRKQNTKLKKVQVRPFESPTYMDSMDSDVDIRPAGLKKKAPLSHSVPKQQPSSPTTAVSNPESEVRREDPPIRQAPTILRTEPSIDQESEPGPKVAQGPEPKSDRESVDGKLDKHLQEDDGDDDRSRATSSPDIREWVEGEEYDSDEYEIVEVEVTDTEEESDARESNNQDSEPTNARSPLLNSRNSNSNNNGVSSPTVPHAFESSNGAEESSEPPRHESPLSARLHSRPEHFSKSPTEPASYEAVLNRQTPSPEPSPEPRSTPEDIRRRPSPRISPRLAQSPFLNPRSPVSPELFRSPKQRTKSPSPQPSPPIKSRTPVRSPITHPTNPSRSASHFGNMSPPAARSPTTTPPISRSPLMRQTRFDIPVYNRTTSSGSTGSSDSSRSGSKYSNQVPARTSRTGRSTNAVEPEEEVKICPKALSTIESFFSFGK